MFPLILKLTPSFITGKRNILTSYSWNMMVPKLLFNAALFSEWVVAQQSFILISKQETDMTSPLAEPPSSPKRKYFLGLRCGTKSCRRMLSVFDRNGGATMLFCKCGHSMPNILSSGIVNTKQITLSTWLIAKWNIVGMAVLLPSYMPGKSSTSGVLSHAVLQCSKLVMKISQQVVWLVNTRSCLNEMVETALCTIAKWRYGLGKDASGDCTRLLTAGAHYVFLTMPVHTNFLRPCNYRCFGFACLPSCIRSTPIFIIWYSIFHIWTNGSKKLK